MVWYLGPFFSVYRCYYSLLLKNQIYVIWCCPMSNVRPKMYPAYPHIPYVDIIKMKYWKTEKKKKEADTRHPAIRILIRCQLNIKIIRMIIHLKKGKINERKRIDNQFKGRSLFVVFFFAMQCNYFSSMTVVSSFIVSIDIRILDQMIYVRF